MDKFSNYFNNNSTANDLIPMTEMELRSSLLMAAAHAAIILMDANPNNGNEVFHRKLIEAEIEKIIKTAKERKRD